MTNTYRQPVEGSRSNETHRESIEGVRTPSFWKRVGGVVLATTVIFGGVKAAEGGYHAVESGIERLMSGPGDANKAKDAFRPGNTEEHIVKYGETPFGIGAAAEDTVDGSQDIRGFADGVADQEPDGLQPNDIVNVPKGTNAIIEARNGNK